MTLDLLGGLVLTVSASIVVAILARGLAGSTGGRVGIVAGFGLWFVIVTALAATGVLHDTGPSAVAGLGVAVLAPVLALVAAAAASAPVLDAVRRIPVTWLVLLNASRVLGVLFLLLYAQGRLPAPFAPAAGWGDIVVGATAPLVAWLIARRHAVARPALILWNTAGLIDLITAVSLGVAASPGLLHVIGTSADSGLMTTLPWMLIPAFLVPILIASHLA